MKTTKKLRISNYKDYLAVDVIDEQKKIVSTPFYLKRGETKIIKYKDAEDGRWNKTEASIKDDFTKLKLKDIDSDSDFTGMEWESEFDELVDGSIIKFIEQ